jgi:hypothetical protein
VSLINGAAIDWLSQTDDYTRYIDDFGPRRYQSRERAKQLALFTNDDAKSDFYCKNYIIKMSESFIPYFNHRTKNKYVTNSWQPAAIPWSDHPLYILHVVQSSMF